MLRSFSLVALTTLFLASISHVQSTCQVSELSTYSSVRSGVRDNSNVLSSNLWRYDATPPGGPYLDQCINACTSNATVNIALETIYNVFYVQINGRYLLADYTWSAVVTSPPNNAMIVGKDTKSTLNGGSTFFVGYNTNPTYNAKVYNYYQPEYAFVFPYWNCPATPSATAYNYVNTGNIIPTGSVPNYPANYAPCGTSWTTFSFTVKRYCPSWIRGDPAFVGLRGQDYQIHGIDGGVYNVISAPEYSINSRFVWLKGPRPCPVIPSAGKKSVACFQHEGSYLSNLAIMNAGGKNTILIESGSAASGLRNVVVNGKPMKIGGAVSLGDDQFITYNSTHEVSMKIGVFDIEVENIDEFINLSHVGVKSADWSRLSRDDVHGLLGQTWASSTLKSKRVIEGIVDDYLIESNDLFHTDFMYNRFKLAQE